MLKIFFFLCCVDFFSFFIGHIQGTIILELFQCVGSYFWRYRIIAIQKLWTPAVLKFKSWPITALHNKHVFLPPLMLSFALSTLKGTPCLWIYSAKLISPIKEEDNLISISLCRIVDWGNEHLYELL